MRTKTSYLEFYKQILGKVSFDRYLFIKEFQKAMKTLSEEERSELEKWIHRHYQNVKN